MNQASSNTNNMGSTARVAIIAIAFVALLLGGFYIWTSKHQPELPVTAPLTVDREAPSANAVQPLAESPIDSIPTEAEAASVNKPLRPIVPAPTTLEGSDNQVKLAVADLAPDMAAWIVSDQQIRKWVLAIDNMADGDVPKQYRPLSYPIARFEPEVRGVDPGQQFFMKLDSYKRTDLLVNLLVAVDPQYFAQYYQAWLPTLEKAYQEQGKKDKFDQRFRVALQHVIDVKPLASTSELKKRGGVIYTYADSKLEAATDVEKMMWRMGPDNSFKIQNYAKQVQMSLPK